MKELDNDRIQSYLTTNRCESVMNVPYSSQWGGVWEGQIRTTRSIRSSGQSYSTDFCSQRSQRKNGYVLTVIAHLLVWSHGYSQQSTIDISMCEWSKELEPLTPNHLLTMKNKTLLPPPGNFVKEEVYVQKRWRKVQFLAEQFWSRWWKDYLTSVNSRQKWLRPKRNLKIGNIVIVQEVPRNEWPLGKIMPIGDFNRSTRFFLVPWR